jgi:hypothetical protein
MPLPSALHSGASGTARADHCRPPPTGALLPWRITAMSGRVAASTSPHLTGEIPSFRVCLVPPSFHPHPWAADPTTQAPPVRPRLPRQCASWDHSDRTLGTSGAANQAGWASAPTHIAAWPTSRRRPPARERCNRGPNPSQHYSLYSNFVIL